MKPRALHKGPSKVELSIGPIMVKCVVKGFTKGLTEHKAWAYFHLFFFAPWYLMDTHQELPRYILGSVMYI